MTGSENSPFSVTAIVTCYNEGDYICDAVNSILSQTRSDLIDQILVLDDGSESDTLSTLAGIEGLDPRIQVVYGPGGARQAAQRNLGASRATSPLIAFLDGDDMWTPDKLERQVALLSRDPGVCLIYSDFYVFASGHLDAARRAGAKDVTASRDLSIEYFLNDPPILPSTILVDREAYLRIGGMDRLIHCFEETDFYLRLAKVGRFGFVGEPLSYKRNRPVSVTAGRKDLMAFHAYVAFKAAAEDACLLPLVTRRLAERARKLGNHHFLLGDQIGAKQLLRLATQLDCLNWRAWGGLALLVTFGRALDRMFARRLGARRAALGVAGR